MIQSFVKDSKKIVIKKTIKKKLYICSQFISPLWCFFNHLTLLINAHEKEKFAFIPCF